MILNEFVGYPDISMPYLLAINALMVGANGKVACADDYLRQQKDVKNSAEMNVRESIMV
jgi:hypothetical protein